MNHGWHLFDDERGYEVSRYNDIYRVRKSDDPHNIIELTENEFDQFRSEGPNPKGLD